MSKQTQQLVELFLRDPANNAPLQVASPIMDNADGSHFFLAASESGACWKHTFHTEEMPPHCEACNQSDTGQTGEYLCPVCARPRVWDSEAEAEMEALPDECSDESPFKKEMPNPTAEMIESPEFNALWNLIKTWDINVPEYYEGYCGANGSHVQLLLDALNSAQPANSL